MNVNGINLNKSVKLSMIRGDSETILVRIKEYKPVSGDKVEFTVRREWNDSTKLITKSTSSFNANSEALIQINPSDTSSLNPDTYVYDIQMTVGGKTKTVVPCSPFEILPEVTYGN